MSGGGLPELFIIEPIADRGIHATVEHVPHVQDIQATLIEQFLSARQDRK
jgi:hypothetical protein